MNKEITLVEQLKRENDALKRELAVLRTLSFEDPLTRLKNRRYFDQRLVTELDRAERHGEAVSVVIADVDDFKHANDRFGHEVGDRLLRWVAKFLTTNVREHDIVCRTGGDEFALILPKADAAGASRLVARLRGALDEAGLNLSAYRVRLSLGAATWDDRRYADLSAFIADADRAMYRDKRRHKGDAAPPLSTTWS